MCGRNGSEGGGYGERPRPTNLITIDISVWSPRLPPRLDDSSRRMNEEANHRAHRARRWLSNSMRGYRTTLVTDSLQLAGPPDAGEHRAVSVKGPPGAPTGPLDGSVGERYGACHTH
jgi:hypothetical protein